MLSCRCVLLSCCCCCSARTRNLPRELWGPAATLESKAAFIAAILNRATAGQQFKNKVNSLYNELQREQQQQQQHHGAAGGGLLGRGMLGGGGLGIGGGLGGGLQHRQLGGPRP